MLVPVSLVVSALYVAVPTQAMPTQDLQLSFAEMPFSFSVITLYPNFAKNQAGLSLGMKTKVAKSEIDTSDNILERNPTDWLSRTTFKVDNVDSNSVPLHYNLDNKLRRRFTRSAEGGSDVGSSMQEKAMEGAMNGAGMVEGGFGAGESGAKAAKDMTDAGKQMANSAGKGAEMMGSGAEVMEAGMKQGKDMASSMGG